MIFSITAQLWKWCCFFTTVQQILLRPKWQLSKKRLGFVCLFDHLFVFANTISFANKLDQLFVILELTFKCGVAKWLSPFVFNKPVISPFFCFSLDTSLNLRPVHLRHILCLAAITNCVSRWLEADTNKANYTTQRHTVASASANYPRPPAAQTSQVSLQRRWDLLWMSG